MFSKPYSRKHIALKILALVLIVPVTIGTGRSGGRGSLPPHVEGHILVRFKNHVTSAGKAKAVDALGKVIRDYSRYQTRKTKAGEDVYSTLVLVQLDEKTKGCTCASAIAELMEHPDVLYAEPDYIGSIKATPNDGNFNLQWGAHNTGQTIQGQAGTADADMDLPEAWDITTGNSAVIAAVIDTGVDYNHGDLAPNIWTNPGEIPGNGVDDDGNGYVDDYYGWDFYNNDNDPNDDHSHGTHIAGIIGAVGNNGTGVAGVAWTCKIMALKVWSASGDGPDSNVLSAMQYADQKGAKVQNHSWGIYAYSQALQDAVTASNNAGAIVVAAADNVTSTTPQYPAANTGVFAVTNTDNRDVKNTDASYGSWIDLCAPGTEIYSTYPGSYGYKTGCSMACPQVVGVCVLLLGYGVSKTLTEQVLLDGCDNIDAANPTYAGQLGRGRVNAYNSLSYFTETTPPTAPTLTGATGLNGSQARVDGTDATDNKKVAGYYIERSVDNVNFVQVTGTYPSFPMTVSGLDPWTTYYFRARAYDYAGNIGPYSNGVSTSTLSNGAPNTPATPTGSTSPVVDLSFSYTTSATDPDANSVQFVINWGDGATTTTGFVGSGSSGSDAHSWTSTGTFTITVQATDIYGATSTVSTPLLVTVIPNQPPSVPNAPTGITMIPIGVSSDYVTGGSSDPTSFLISYEIDWGDGSTTASGQMVPGPSSTFIVGHSWGTLGTYTVTARATDQQGLSSPWSSGLVVEVVENTPPNTPSRPSGPTSPEISVSNRYTTSATDLSNHAIKYTFDWGDGTVTTTDYFSSGATGSASHTWTTAASYNIRAMATDAPGASSGWSPTLSVTVIVPAQTQGSSSGGNPAPMAGGSGGGGGGGVCYVTASSEDSFALVMLLAATAGVLLLLRRRKLFFHHE